MYKPLIFIAIILFVVAQLSAQTNSRAAYINKFKKIAIKEMERSGVPASIKLAQGILESNAGQSTLARRANNHFGMKCGPAWKGKEYYHKDDDYDADGKLIESCFRVFKNPMACFIAHSEFLRDPNKAYRYGFLFRLDPTDYRAWSRGLKKAGYATSPTYAEKLIKVIEDNELFRFDNMLPGDKDPVDAGGSGPLIVGMFEVNNVDVILAEANETAADVAIRTGVSISRILKYNEAIDDPHTNLKKDTRVYLQRKRGSYRGKKKFHFVKAKETMFFISQLYGLRLKKLYKKNRMVKGTEPAEGEEVKIRGWRIKKDKIPKLKDEAESSGPSQPDIEFEWENENVDPDDEEEFFEIEFEDTDLEEVTPVEAPPVIDEPVETPPVADPVLHSVVKGDTLFGLARLYGTTVENIKAMNSLNSDIISVGMLLRVR